MLRVLGYNGPMRNALLIGGGVVISFCLAALWVFIFTVGAHLWQDHRTLHDAVGLINYNIAVGVLKTPEAAPAASTAAPPTPKSPTAK